MKVSYDKEVDAAYIQLSESEAEGVIEIAEGISVDIDANSKIIGIEILSASKKLSLEDFFKFEIDESTLWRKTA